MLSVDKLESLFFEIWLAAKRYTIKIDLISTTGDIDMIAGSADEYPAIQKWKVGRREIPATQFDQLMRAATNDGIALQYDSNLARDP